MSLAYVWNSGYPAKRDGGDSAAVPLPGEGKHYDAPGHGVPSHRSRCCPPRGERPGARRSRRQG
jgi:hypothetical protein